MNYFWSNVFEYFKDRRLGAVFFAALAMVIGLILLGAVFGNFQQAWPIIFTGLGILLLVLIWRGIRRARSFRSNRYKPSALSRDELAKARSKLKTKPTFKSS
ncbi:MAG TPA: hypothetical protein VFF11_06825 [Candidatus Binatia bacterium]|nr:hypothetical protein [Candidatus Binatia bacterium]